jgi:hypothetical protein
MGYSAGGGSGFGDEVSFFCAIPDPLLKKQP